MAIWQFRLRAMARRISTVLLVMMPLAGTAAPAGPDSSATPADSAGAAVDSASFAPDREAVRRVLRKAVRRPGAGDSLRYAAALELGRSDKIDDRILALDLLDGLRLGHRDDPEYHRDLAHVLEASHQPTRARQSLEELLKLRPDDVEARVEIARLRLQEMIQHYDLSLTTPMLEVLRSALRDAPDHDGALLLAALALELQGSLNGPADPSRLAEGMTLARKILEAHPDNAEARFLLAVLHLDLGQNEEAGRQFEWALANASADWRGAMASTEWTAPEEAVSKLHGLDGPARERYAEAYWSYHDPTPITLLNENQMEIWKRIVLAEFLFGNPERGLRGWNTPPGEAFIRYGPPVVHQFEAGAIVGDGGARSRAPIKLIPSALVWGYRYRNLSFNLRFEDMSCNYNFQPSPGSRMLLSSLRRQVPVIFQEAPPGNIRQLYLASAGTATGGRKCRESIRLGVPLWRPTGDGSWIDQVRLEIVVKDSTRAVVRRSLRGAMADDVHLLIDDLGVLLMTSDFELDPGHYTVAAFVEDPGRKSRGVLSVPMEVRDFRPPLEFQISDLELTLDTGEETPAPAESRHGVRNVPNPLGIIGDGRRLDLFYEIYGLQERDGVSRHEVRYTIVPREYARLYERRQWDGEIPGREDLVARIVAGRTLGDYDLTERNSLDVVFPEQASTGSAGRVPRATRVGIPRLDSGEYVLIVTVHDILADATRSARVCFRVMPDARIRELLTAARRP